MHYYHKFAIIGFIISLVAIILGITGLTTSNWISINHNQSSHAIIYDLFSQYQKNQTIECTDTNPFRTSQYIEIIGYIILVAGLFVGVLCTALVNKHTIHFIPPIIIIIGTITILIGCIFYIKNLVEFDHPSSIMELNLGYSMILMISTSIMGCILIAYFSFTAGYIYRHILATGIGSNRTFCPLIVLEFVLLTMVNYQFLVLITAAIGLVPIVFGIIGLATPDWINVELISGGLTNVYSLFRRCVTVTAGGAASTTCTDIPTFKTAQGLEIAGVVIIAIGIVIGIILKLLSPTGNIHLISPLLPMIGSVLILIGFLVYAKYVIENFAAPLIEVNIGYSMILMVIACISGFLVTAYFSFTTGYIYQKNRLTINVS